MHLVFRAAMIVFLKIVDDTAHPSCADDLEMLHTAGAFLSARASRAGGSKGNAATLSKLCLGFESIARNATLRKTQQVVSDEFPRGDSEDKHSHLPTPKGLAQNSEMDGFAQFPAVAELCFNDAETNPSTDCMVPVVPSSLISTMILGNMEMLELPRSALERP